MITHEILPRINNIHRIKQFRTITVFGSEVQQNRVIKIGNNFVTTGIWEPVHPYRREHMSKWSK